MAIMADFLPFCDNTHMQVAGYKWSLGGTLRTSLLHSTYAS